jgi:hypothetical protein
MKFATVSLFATAAFAGFASADANKPMLRASIAQGTNQTGIYGSIDAQVVLSGAALTHELSRAERLQVATCFINTYNEAQATTGYEVYGFRIKMSHFHNSTTDSWSEDADTTTTATRMKAAPSHKSPYVLLTSGTGFACNLCAPSLLLELGDANVPPLSDAFVTLFQDCLTATGYPGVDDVSIGFFAPTVTTYLDPVMLTSSSDAKSATAAIKTTTTSVAKTAVDNTKLSDVPAESDVFLYGLEDELSDSDDGVVANCFLTAYNQQYESGDWVVDSVSINWETVIGGDATTTGYYAPPMIVTNRVRSFSYLLMDASISYACTLCNEAMPQETTLDHVAFEGLFSACLTQSGSSAFELLENIEVRNLLGSNNKVVVATMAEKK